MILLLGFSEIPQIPGRQVVLSFFPGRLQFILSLRRKQGVFFYTFLHLQDVLRVLLLLLMLFGFVFVRIWPFALNLVIAANFLASAKALSFGLGGGDSS